MTIYFSKLYVDTVAKGLLEQGERLVGASGGTHSPWWSFGVSFFKSQYLVLATSERLVVVRHKPSFMKGFQMDNVTSIPLSRIDSLKTKGLFFGTSLAISSSALKATIKMSGSVMDMKQSMEGAKAAASTWSSARALPSGRATGGLLAA